MDERLSSHAARELQQHGNRGVQAGIDALAAMIILQNWLESEHGHD
jgi:RNase H-fold protein (predicted Holliday junction resolvase)